MPQTIFFAYANKHAKANIWYLPSLRKAAEEMGAQPLFARDRASHSHILDHVSDCIDEADIGFYDITGLNPNVLIEYGIGHASGKPCFLLVHATQHIQEVNQAFGKRSVPIEMPADLHGILHYSYSGHETLIAEVKRVVEQNLNPEDRERELVAKSIVESLRSTGPSNMSAIAARVGRSIDFVRPVLRMLLATGKVIREGHAKGSKYRPA